MTFGSMLAMANDETTYCVRALLEAAEQARCRAIVQAPWPDLPELPRSERVLRLGRAPHTVLLASAAAMVHHGGAGTTQAACLAGRPSVVVPFLGDQTFWAGRLKALGIAPAALLRTKLEPRGLAKRIRAVLDDPGMRTRAEAIASSMRREDGVARATEWISQLEASKTR
jgi:UDP:flavonoid glycosyltransferase YjiC (YdhE family)